MENEEGGAEDEKVIKMLEPFFHVRRAETFLPAFFSIRALWPGFMYRLFLNSSPWQRQ